MNNINPNISLPSAKVEENSSYSLLKQKVISSCNYYYHVGKHIYNRTVFLCSNNNIIPIEVFKNIVNKEDTEEATQELEKLLANINYYQYKNWLFYSSIQTNSYNRKNRTPMEYVSYGSKNEVILKKLIDILIQKHLEETQDIFNPLGFVINNNQKIIGFLNRIGTNNFDYHKKQILEQCIFHNIYIGHILPYVIDDLEFLSRVLSYVIRNTCIVPLKSLLAGIKKIYLFSRDTEKDKKILSVFSDALCTAVRVADIEQFNIMWDFTCYLPSIEKKHSIMKTVIRSNNTHLFNVVIKKVGINTKMYLPHPFFDKNPCSMSCFCYSHGYIEHALIIISLGDNICCSDQLLNSPHTAYDFKGRAFNPFCILIRDSNYDILEIFMALGAKLCTTENLLHKAFGIEYQLEYQHEYSEITQIINNPASLARISSVSIAKYWTNQINQAKIADITDFKSRLKSKDILPDHVVDKINSVVDLFTLSTLFKQEINIKTLSTS